MEIVEAVLYGIPLWLWNPTVIREVFYLVQKDNGPRHVAFILSHKTIINIIEVQNYWWRLLNCIKLHHKLLRFIIKRIICLLYNLRFDSVPTWWINFNKRIRCSSFIARGQWLCLIDVSSDLECVLALWQRLLPRLDSVRVKLSVFMSLVKIKPETKDTGLCFVSYLPDRQVWLKRYPLQLGVRICIIQRIIFKITNRLISIH